jgi:hypothetical protein
MPANTYQLGDAIMLYAQVTDKSGNLIDPATLEFRWRAESTPKSGATVLVYGTDPSVVRDAVGQYHCEIKPVVSGLHFYSVLTDKNNEEAKFVVEASNF